MKIVTKCTLKQFETIKNHFCTKFPFRYRNMTVYHSKRANGYFVIVDEPASLLFTTINFDSGLIYMELDKFVESLNESLEIIKRKADDVKDQESKEIETTQHNGVVQNRLRFTMGTYQINIIYPENRISEIPKSFPTTEEELKIFIAGVEGIKGAKVEVSSKNYLSVNYSEDPIKDIFMVGSEQAVSLITLAHDVEFEIEILGHKRTLKTLLPKFYVDADPELKNFKKMVEDQVLESVKINNIDLNDKETIFPFIDHVF